MDDKEPTAPGPDNSHPSDPADSAPSQPEGSAGPEVPQSQSPEDNGSQRPDQPTDKNSAQETKNQTALVRYGRLKMLGEFRRPNKTQFATGTKVIVRTQRGIEIGQIVLGYCEGPGDRGVSRRRLQDYLAQCGREGSVSRQGQILRAASAQDLIDQRHLDQAAADKIQFCQQLIGQMSLDMKPVEVEHLFGGDRIIFYFKSEKRVDFRKLVCRLAKEYQTRIEMRQVGARDEAKLLADYERCGRACCCRSFLKLLAPVNMRMAKVQKATLDPAKISGRCGRLMCCLRYENCTYDELRKKFPPRNTLVTTPQGPGVVVDRHILTQLVVVRLPDARRAAYPLAEISVEPRNGSKAIEQDGLGRDDDSDSANQAQSSQQPDSESQSTASGSKKRRRRNRRKSN